MSTEEAIVHIKDVICENNTIKPNIVVFEQEKEALYMAIKALEQEPKTGEWQQDLDGTYLCSECGSGFKEQPTLMGKPMFLWCPLCGAKMVSHRKGARMNDLQMGSP